MPDLEPAPRVADADGAGTEPWLDGGRVRRLRTDRGLPEVDLLTALNLSVSRWRRLLAGRETCERSEVDELAGALCVTATEILA